MYHDESYRKFPTLTLSVSGHDVTFLVDSGATSSVLTASALPFAPKLSGRTCLTVGASGKACRDSYSAPIRCELDDQMIKHSFIVSKNCPINLLGRDLMCRFGIILHSTPDGVKVLKQSNPDYPFTTQMFEHSPFDLLYVYEWQLLHNTLSHTPDELTSFAHTHSTQAGSFMTPQRLHCTAHVSEGKDTDFEKDWYAEVEELEELSLTHIYWTKSVAVVSVALSAAQDQIFQNKTPHISLAKPATWTWQDLGPWVRGKHGCSDFCRTGDPRTEYSETGDVYRTAVTSTVRVKRTVELLENIPRGSSVYTLMTAESMPAELSQVPDCLWAKHKYDVGLMKDATPLVIHPKSDYRPCLKQYPLKQEAIDGITPVFESLLKAGIIVPCNDSPVRTPIFPVKKIRDEDQPTEWRFVQDLQAVNAAVHPRAPEVSNPHTILSLIPPHATHFSVVDLANAFFSVPVHPESQYWFAFTFQGRSYTWTRCAQGYSESPTYFHQQLNLNLQNFEFPSGSVLLTYVDDIMVASPSEEACKTDTVALLTFLANSGHKASLSKLQFAQTKVTYLGHVITAEGKSLSPKRIAAIQNVPKPLTKKHVLSFLRNDVILRQWIPKLFEREAPLSATVHGKKLTAHGKITWTPEAEKAFADLKSALINAPTLDSPNSNKPFVQFIDQKGGYATSVLCQKHGDKLRPVAYFSTKLDPVATGLPPCLRAVAAAEKAVIASRDLVGYSELILMVPHAIAHILHTQKTSHLSAQRWLSPTFVLEMPMFTGNAAADVAAKAAAVKGDMFHILFSSSQPDVKAVLPTPADTPQHNFKPGDWVVIKDFRRKHWKQRRFQGPFQVLLITQTAVKVA
ncbi:uncharacterized protein LOC118326328, partial [Morone saxatilis]|uniref:uncharacterized protein LOC118326328 n=1 Tax=Morone saxatilis TaxID=34816 RepID=UPI0015E1BCA5